MAKKLSAIIEQAQEIQGTLWGAASGILSEAVNAAVRVQRTEVKAVEPEELADLAPDGAVVQFSLGHRPLSQLVVLIGTAGFNAFYGALEGRRAREIDEAFLTENRPFFEALAQGIAVGIGNCRQEPTVPAGLVLSVAPFVPSDGLLTSPTLFLVKTVLEAGGAQLELSLLLDDAVMTELLPPEEEADIVRDRATGHIGPSGSPPDDRSLQLLYDIPLEITVQLGRVKMIVKDVLELGPGSIVEIEKAAGEPVDVLVNGRQVARGEVVVIDDNFGVRITEILNPAERLNRLGEAA